MKIVNSFYNRSSNLFSYILFFFSSLLILLSPKIVLSFSQVQVTINQNGFSSNQVKINQGDTVVFKNIDSKPHWPASDLHPTHLIYPEFDPKKGIEEGQSWSFVFQKKGSFNFHDHLNPTLVGQVIVKGDNRVEGKRDWKQSIDSLQKKLRVWFYKSFYQLFPAQLDKRLAGLDFVKMAKDSEQISFWLQIIGSDKVMDKLIADSKGGAAFDCHQEAHLIGREAYMIFHSNVFHKGNSGCHSGFYHGAMESFLNEQGTDNLASKIDHLCASFETSFTKFECLHGVGHGVMAYQNYDLPKAIWLCKSLSTQFAQASCFGGLFMENIITAQGRGAGGVHQTKWVSSDPFFPCDQTDQTYPVQYQCYLMQTSRMLDLMGYDFNLVAKQCLQAPQDYKPVCFQSLGRDAAGVTLRDPDKILSICSQVDSQFYEKCIQGALNVIVDFWGDKLQNQAVDFCQKVPVISSKESCLTLLEQRRKEIF